MRLQAALVFTMRAMVFALFARAVDFSAEKWGIIKFNVRGIYRAKLTAVKCVYTCQARGSKTKWITRVI